MVAAIMVIGLRCTVLKYIYIQIYLKAENNHFAIKMLLTVNGIALLFIVFTIN